MLIVKSLVFILLGVSIYHHERMMIKGSLIIVANHNSHLDTLVLGKSQQLIYPPCEYDVGQVVIWTGKRIVKEAPAPTWLLTLMSPPIALQYS